MKDINVFCFHRVSDEISPAYPPIPVKVFNKIVDYITKEYMVVPIVDVNCKNSTKKQKAVLTFDDGYYDFYENAMAVLSKYNISAVQHIISNCVESGATFWTQKLNKLIEYAYSSKQKLSISEIDIDLYLTKESQLEKIALLCFKRLAPRLDKEDIINNLIANIGSDGIYTKMMTWNEVIECSKHNIYFGSHSHTHQNLSVLNEVDLHNEIGLSVGLIRNKIGNCVSLAFPNGYYSVETINVALQYNIPFLFTTEKNHIIPNIDANVITRYSLYHKQWWKNYIRLKLFT